MTHSVPIDCVIGSIVVVFENQLARAFEEEYRQKLNVPNFLRNMLPFEELEAISSCIKILRRERILDVIIAGATFCRCIIEQNFVLVGAILSDLAQLFETEEHILTQLMLDPEVRIQLQDFWKALKEKDIAKIENTLQVFLLGQQQLHVLSDAVLQANDGTLVCLQSDIGRLAYGLRKSWKFKAVLCQVDGEVMFESDDATRRFKDNESILKVFSLLKDSFEERIFLWKILGPEDLETCSKQWENAEMDSKHLILYWFWTRDPKWLDKMLKILLALRSAPWSPDILSYASSFGLLPQQAVSLLGSDCFKATLFRKEHIRIRTATLGDVPQLCALESGWNSSLSTTAGVVSIRISNYPCLVGIIDEKIVAVLYCQTIKDAKELWDSSYETIENLFDRDGKILNLIAAFGRKDDNNGVAGLLVLFCIFKSGHDFTPQICAVTRWSNFKTWKSSTNGSYEEYMAKGNDPTVNWHIQRGAHVQGLVQNFRPKDTDNDGIGVFITYDIEKLYKEKSGPLVLKKSTQFSRKSAQVVLEKCLRNHVDKNIEIHQDSQFMDLKIDSLELPHLLEEIREKLGLAFLPATSFFRYPTVSAFLNHLFPGEYNGMHDELLEVISQNSNGSTKSLSRSTSLRDLGITGKKLKVLSRKISTKFGRSTSLSSLASDSSVNDLLRATTSAAASQRILSKQERSDVFVAGKSCSFGLQYPELWQELLSSADLTRTLHLRDSFDTYGVRIPQRDLFGFDSSFWGISPKEARYLDPQQHLLLKNSVWALEDCQEDFLALRGDTKTGVFVGCWNNDFRENFPKDGSMAYYGTGSLPSLTAGRISYVFGLEGPCMAIDTACSSGLVAFSCSISYFQESITRALIGSANVILTESLSRSFSEAGMLAPDGRCKTFDQNANGYVRSEGCVVLVLKSTYHHDQFSSLKVLSNEINQDGRSAGLTAPNQKSQENLLKSAWTGLNKWPTFIEAHGTGTSLGDPIEFNAIVDSFGSACDTSIVIGSVKTNMGHSESCAGLLGMLKIFAIKNSGTISKHLHFSMLNPHIELSAAEALQVVVPCEEVRLKQVDCAFGVSSFGFSGTNCHIVVDSESSTAPSEQEEVFLCLNTRLKDPLDSLTRDVASHLILRHSPCIMRHVNGDFCKILYSSSRKEAAKMLVNMKGQTKILKNAFGLYFPDRGWKFVRGDCGFFRTFPEAVNFENRKFIHKGLVTAVGTTLCCITAHSYFAHSDLSIFSSGCGGAAKKFVMGLIPFQDLVLELNRDEYGKESHEVQMCDIALDCGRSLVPTANLKVIRFVSKQHPVENILALEFFHITCPKLWNLRTHVKSFHHFSCPMESEISISTEKKLFKIEWQYCNSFFETKHAQLEFVHGRSKEFELALEKNSKFDGRRVGVVFVGRPKKISVAHAMLLASRDFLKLLSRNITEFFFVTVRGVKVDPTDSLCIFNCALWGLFRGIRAEYSQKIACIDVFEFGHLKLLQKDVSPIELCVRGDSHFVPRLKKFSLVTKKRDLKGAVLLIGGSGGIGQMVLIWIARHEKVSSIHIVGRSGFEGVSVLPLDKAVLGSYRVDFGAQGASKATLAIMPESFDLVLHLAGVLEPRLLEDITAKSFKRTFHSKIQCFQNFSDTYRRKSDAILFSSQAAVSPDVGQAVYASANNALEAFSSENVIVLKFGAFEGTNMYKNLGETVRNREKSLWKSRLSEQDLIFCLKRMLHDLIIFDPATENEDFLKSSIGRAAIFSNQDLVKSTSPKFDEQDVESIIREVLGIPAHSDLDVDAPLRDLGFDSFLSVQLAAKLSKTFGIHAKPTIAFDFPTIRRLKDFFNVKNGDVSEQTQQLSTSMPIRAIGSSCRFGDTKTSESLWQKILQGQDFISVIPKDRWNWLDSQKAGCVSKWGAFVDQIYSFDHENFKISLKEAQAMDPQHKMVLDCSWESIEDAGMIPTEFGVEFKSASVIVGIQESEYKCRFESINSYRLVGTSQSAASGRVSYFFNFEGPCLTVDTACSSSLVAIHVASQQLQHGCEAAFALGVNSIFEMDFFLSLSWSGMLSPSGRCKTFDESADGYVRAEGCGCLLLSTETESDCSMTRDTIVTSSQINQDGRSNGLTAPNGQAQASLLKRFWRGTKPQFFEVHGSATPLGDPIEVNAICETFSQKQHPFVFGCVKTNFGHSESAAGLLGALRIIGSFEKSTWAKFLHFNKLNPYIGEVTMYSFSGIVPLENLKHNQLKLEAGLSSFGFTGTNAHVTFSCSDKTFSNAPGSLWISKKKDASELQNDFVEGNIRYCLRSKNADSFSRIILGKTLKKETLRDHFEENYMAVARFIFSRTAKETKISKTKAEHHKDNDMVASHTLKNTILDTVAEVLGIFPNEISDSSLLSSLGVDSLGAIEISTRLGLKLRRTDISKTIVYNNPTVELLTKALGGNHPDVSQLSFAETAVTVGIESWALRICDAKTGPELANLVLASFDGIDVIPWSRWNWVDMFSATPQPGKSVSKWGCFSNLMEGFDFEFFGISSREASSMDPQHGALLETCWEAVDSAESFLDALDVSVFVGVAQGEKNNLIQGSDHFQVTGCSDAIAAGRVSFFFGYLGPSLSINTACSSSLVALNEAKLTLQSRVTSKALCCGVMSLWSPKFYVLLSQAGMMSKSGRCKTFDESADGYVRGEGCVTFALSTSTAAPTTLIGSATNQDGKRNGLTAPNGTSQAIVIRTAQRNCHSAPSYVELHGTGTCLGDPIEMEALSSTLKGGNPLCVRSSKTNFGHLETAAGLLSVASALSCLEKGSIGKHLHLRNLNSHIGESLFYQHKVVVPMESVVNGPSRTVIAVSSFGFSGTNCHAVFETCARKCPENFSLEVRIEATCQEALDLRLVMIKSWIISQGLKVANIIDQSCGRKNRAHFCGRLKDIAGRIRNECPIVVEKKPSNQFLKGSFSVAKKTMPNAGKPLEEQRMVEKVTAVVAKILETSSLIDENQPFQFLGFDSIMCLELSQKISELVGAPVSATLAYDYPTCIHVAQYINSLSSTSDPLSQEVELTDFKDNFSCFLDGWGCRLASCINKDELWDRLVQKSDFVEEIPSDRWKWNQYFTEEVTPSPGKTKSKWGCFLKEIQLFDTSFFHISQKEAQNMDPQQRLILETSFEALEHSYLTMPDIFGESVGVFGGIERGEFSETCINFDNYLATGVSDAIATGRVSYFFGITGPAISINTACSSALVALSIASSSIKADRLEGAFCYGVKVLLNPLFYVILSQAMMLSPTGRCKAFDRSADGYVRAEGCATVYLRPSGSLLELMATSVNQDGASNGLTAPNGPSQVSMIQRARKRAGITCIDFSEAHGTGTSLGDPIEFSSICKTYGTAARNVLIRSIKTNMGHAEHGAGIFGVLSSVLSATRKALAAHLHLTHLNPFIGTAQAETSLITIPLEKVELSERTLFCVSSFGYSGTNCHAIFKSGPDERTFALDASEILLHISARHDLHLVQVEETFSSFLIECQLSSNMLKKFKSQKFAKSKTFQGNCVKQLVTTMKRRILPKTTRFPQIPWLEESVPVQFSAPGASKSSDGVLIQFGPKDALVRVAYENLSQMYCVSEHLVYEKQVVPAAFHLSLVCQHLASVGRVPAIKDIEILTPVVVDEVSDAFGSFLVYKYDESRFEVTSTGTDDFKKHVQGFVDNTFFDEIDIDSSQGKAQGVSWERLLGIWYGPSFRWLNNVSKHQSVVTFDLCQPKQWSIRQKLNLPAEMVDSSFQSTMFFLSDNPETFMAPFHCEAFQVKHPYVSSTLQGKTLLHRMEDKSLKATITISSLGQNLCIVKGLTLIKAPKDAIHKISSSQQMQYFYEIRWKPFQKIISSKDNGLVIFGRHISKYSGYTCQSYMSVFPDSFVDCNFNVIPLDILNGATGRDVLMSCLTLFQTFMKSRLNCSLLSLVPRANRILPGEKVHPWSSSLWSMGRSFSKELGSGKSHILLDSSSFNDEIEMSEHGAEFAERNGKFFKAVLSKVVEFSGKRDFPRTIAITGGLGSLGLVFAKILADLEIFVILLGRSARKCGLSGKYFVGLVDCNIDEDVMSCILSTSITAGDPVRTAFHCAGTLDDRNVLDVDKTSMFNVLKPKVCGARALFKAIRMKNFVSFSSATSTLGNAGQCNYGAANGFLDGLCQSGKSGCRFQSICWGPWDTGMFAKLKSAAPMLKEDEAPRLLDLSWKLEKNVFMVMKVDWSSNFAESLRTPITDDLLPKKSAVKISREHVRSITLNCVSKVLSSSDQVDENQPLSELGLDSALGIELRMLLANGTGIQLPATFLYDFPTLGSLIERLENLCEPSAEKASKDLVRILKPTDKGFVGIRATSCRFSGCSTSSELWAIFESGRDCINVVPKSRFDWRDTFSTVLAPGKSVTKWGSFIESIDLFDATFFSISPREATAMDPKNRFLLETAWEACEDVDLSEYERHNPVGVYVGAWPSEYYESYIHEETSLQFLAIGNSPAAACGRISYFFRLTGACLSIDTACSSSLVALYYGASAISRNQESASLCFGTNSIFSERLNVIMSQAGMMSPDGRCKTFDSSANGYVRGEGCACIFLSSVVSSSSSFLVTGWSINQNGRSQGLTAPHGPTQANLIKMAANMDSSTETPEFLELHGTGTSLGDPIEISGLAQAFSNTAPKAKILGSSKTNFGHTETAAGALGVLKSILSIKNFMVPMNLHMKTLNPFIGTDVLETLAGVIPLENVKFCAPFKAGVSSFGFSGINAHVIISVSFNGPQPNHTISVFGSKLSLKTYDVMAFNLVTLQEVRSSLKLPKRYTILRGGRVVHAKLKSAPKGISLFAVPPKWRSLSLRQRIVIDLKFGVIPEIPLTFREMVNNNGVIFAFAALVNALNRLNVVVETTFGLSSCCMIHQGLLTINEALQRNVDDLNLVERPQKFLLSIGPCISRSEWKINAFGSCRGQKSYTFQDIQHFLLLENLMQPQNVACTALSGTIFNKKSFFTKGAQIPLSSGAIGKKEFTFHPVPQANPFGLMHFSIIVSLESHPELKDLDGLIHIGIWTEFVISSFKEMKPQIQDVSFSINFLKFLFVTKLTQLHLSFEKTAEGLTFEVFGAVNDSWEKYIDGKVGKNDFLVLGKFPETLVKSQSGEEFYKAIEKSGFTVGLSVSRIKEIWVVPDRQVIGLLENLVTDHSCLPVSLGCLDACAQLYFCLSGENSLLMTRKIENLTILSHEQCNGRFFVHLIETSKNNCKIAAYSLQKDLLFSFSCELITFDSALFRILDDVTASDLSQLSKAEIEDVLRGYTSEVTGLSKDEISSKEPLLNFGVDSMMALSIATFLSSRHMAEVSVDDILQGASVESLAMTLRSKHLGKKNSYFEPVNGLDREIHLYCLPYGGGSARTYSSWPSLFGKKWCIFPVELPGHGKRSSETPFHKIEPLVEEISDAILQNSRNHEIALFGHSFGGLLAFCVARKLYMKGVLVRVVGISAFPAPSSENKTLQRFLEVSGLSSVPSFEDVGHIAYASWMRKVDTAYEKITDDQIHLLGKTLNSDLRCVENFYQTFDGGAIKAPLALFCGSKDTQVHPSSMEQWSLCADTVNLEVYDTKNHLFVDEAPFSKSIADVLQRMVILQQENQSIKSEL